MTHPVNKNPIVCSSQRRLQSGLYDVDVILRTIPDIQNEESLNVWYYVAPVAAFVIIAIFVVRRRADTRKRVVHISSLQPKDSVEWDKALFLPAKIRRNT
jgi:hypothetical protein